LYYALIINTFVLVCPVDTTSQLGAAVSFLHLLKLEKRGLVNTSQPAMWDDITITVVEGGDAEVKSS
jgi:chromatin segregation and condensation protein Rec8/ScpA/Scc1 (kleisin family)